MYAGFPEPGDEYLVLVGLAFPPIDGNPAYIGRTLSDVKFEFDIELLPYFMTIQRPRTLSWLYSQFDSEGSGPLLVNSLIMMRLNVLLGKGMEADLETLSCGIGLQFLGKPITDKSNSEVVRVQGLHGEASVSRVLFETIEGGMRVDDLSQVLNDIANTSKCNREKLVLSTLESLPALLGSGSAFLFEVDDDWVPEAE